MPRLFPEYSYKQKGNHSLPTRLRKTTQPVPTASYMLPIRSEKKRRYGTSNTQKKAPLKNNRGKTSSRILSTESENLFQIANTKKRNLKPPPASNSTLLFPKKYGNKSPSLIKATCITEEKSMTNFDTSIIVQDDSDSDVTVTPRNIPKKVDRDVSMTPATATHPILSDEISDLNDLSGNIENIDISLENNARCGDKETLTVHTSSPCTLVRQCLQCKVLYQVSSCHVCSKKQGERPRTAPIARPVNNDEKGTSARIPRPLSSSGVKKKRQQAENSNQKPILRSLSSSAYMTSKKKENGNGALSSVVNSKPNYPTHCRRRHGKKSQSFLWRYRQSPITLPM